MPQVVQLGRKLNQLEKNILPAEDVDLFEDKYSGTRLLDRLQFDPSLTFIDENGNDTGQSVYGLIFNPIEDAYKQMMGTGLDLSKGDIKSVLWNPQEDLAMEKEIARYSAPIDQMMERDAAFSSNVIGERRDLIKRDMAKELYGLRAYVDNHPSLPPKESTERIALDKVINDSFRNGWRNIRHMVESELGSEGARHSQDQSFAAQRFLPSAKKAVGEILIDKSEGIGSLLEFLNSGDGGRWKRVEWGKEGEPEISSDGVISWAEKVREFGAGWTKQEVLEDPEYQPTGIYAMSMKDLDVMQGIANPKYAVATMAESGMTNMIISGSGLLAGYISPGKKLKMLAGFAGAAIPGFLLESVSAKNEAIEELNKIRAQAMIDKKNMTPEAFKALYSYQLSQSYSKTADELSDENIDDIADRIGQVYGILSSGVEGLSTAIEISAATKFFKSAKSMKSIASSAAKGKLGKTIMGAKDIGKFLLKGVGLEGAEEATQETINMQLMERNVPFYKFDPQRVWKAAYSGAVFGGAMAGGGSVVGRVKRGWEQKRLETGAREKLEERKGKAKPGEDPTPFDKDIKAGLFLEFTPTRFVDRLANIHSDNAFELELRAGELSATARNWMNAEHLTNVLSDKKVRENFLITEEKLMSRPGFFTDKQVAKILGKDVKDLKYEHSKVSRAAAPSKRKPKITAKMKKRNMAKKRRKGKKVLGDIERTEPDERSYELAMMRSEFSEVMNDILDLKEIAGTGRMDEDLRKEKLKELEKHKKELASKIKGVNKKKPKRVSKDPLAQEKQRLINEVNALGDESFTPEELASLKLISKAKTKADLKKFKPIIDKAEKRNEQEEVKEGQEKEKVKISLNNLRDNLIATEKEIEEYEGDKRSKEYKELVKEQKKQELLLLETEQETVEAITDESLNNQAENIYLEVANMDGLTVQHSRHQLEQMNNAKLLEIAQKHGIESSDRNKIIAEYLDKLGVDESEQTLMHMGVPLKMPKMFLDKISKKKAEAWFMHTWNQSKEKHGLDDFTFDTWAANIAGRLPSNVRDHFVEWAQSTSPNQTWMESAEGRAITGLFGPPDTFTPDNMDDISNTADEEAAFIKETIAAVNDEDSDLNAASENVINTRAFAPFKTTIDSEVFNAIVTQVNDGNFDSFEDFLAEISQPGYDLITDNGETPLSLSNKNPITRTELKQFYVSKLPENFVLINQGNAPGIRKNISILYTSSTGKFGKKIEYKSDSKPYVSTSYARAMVAENVVDGINDDIVWLDKSDLKQRSPDNFKKWITRTEPLTRAEIAELTRGQFRDANLVPLMMRGDSGRLILANVKDEHKQSALTYLTYWKKEQENGNVSQELADEYSGKNLTEKQMKAIYGSSHDYRAAQIARHEVLKKLFGTTYHELTQQDIMLRNSVMFSTALTNRNGRNSSIYVFNHRKDSPGDVQFVTEFEDGSTESVDAVQFIDGEWQYIGDGTTWTSERVFSEKYVEEVGALSTAKRAKTIKFGHDETGVLLEKHQEMSYSLPAGAVKSSLIDGKEKIAEIRRDPDGINIYVKGDSGNYDQYVDHLASRDEVKVVTGEFEKKMKNNEVISLPSEATGHIQLTGRDKDRANFPMQVLNYLTDPQLLEYVSTRYMRRSKDVLSPQKQLFNMFQILQDSNKMNEFIKKAKISYPGSVSRMIENFADVGVGLHPAGLSLTMSMLKNRLLLKSQDFLHRGGVLDFRASVTEKLADDEMIASADHSMRKHIEFQLSEKLQMDMQDIKRMSLADLNSLLKKNPVDVMMVRFPVPSQSGYRIMKVTGLELGLGDSFKINPKVVKEVFEGDHDHDSGHITILDNKLTKMLKENQVSTAGINIGKYEQQESSGSIANIVGSTQAMAALTQGKMAIGKIASLQRNHGVVSYYLNHLVIDGKKIIIRSLDSPVTDPDMIIAETGKPEKQSLGMMLRTYAQAAFDNPKLRLLDKWKFSDTKLIGMMFQAEDGSALTEAQVNTLALYLSEHNKASQIRNGKSSKRVYKLEELLSLSKDYTEMVQNRERHIVDNVDSKIKEVSVFNNRPYGRLSSLSANENVHPMEVRAMAPYQKLDDLGLGLAEITNQENITSSQAHYNAKERLMQDNFRTQMTAQAAGLTLEQFKKISLDEFSVINEEVQSGVDWGRAVHSKLLALYSKMYDSDNLESARPIDPNAWDHNQDFNDFYHNLYKDGIGGLSAYKDLSKVQQTSATFAFLDRFIKDDGVHADYAGKILPVSKDGITLLDPDVMKRYFNLYNEAAEKIVVGQDMPMVESGAISSVHENQVTELRRIYGCE